MPTIPANTIELQRAPEIDTTSPTNKELHVWVYYFLGTTTGSGPPNATTYTRQSIENTYETTIPYADAGKAVDWWNAVIGAIAAQFGLNLAATYLSPYGAYPPGEGSGTDYLYISAPDGFLS